MTSTGARRRLIAAWAATATTVTIVIAALVLVVAQPSLRAAWWPQTGQAFAASPTPTAHHTADVQGDPAASPAPSADDSHACDAIVGPAKKYCLADPTPDTGRGITPATAWRLAALASGLAALGLLGRRLRRH
jgi:hypothetical protein